MKNCKAILGQSVRGQYKFVMFDLKSSLKFRDISLDKDIIEKTDCFKWSDASGFLGDMEM